MDTSTLVMPAGVSMTNMKTGIKFEKGEKKAYLKGSNFEITNPTKALGSRVKVYSEAVIEKCHLGAVCAAIPAIADAVDLQKVINRYFKTK